MPGRPKEIDSAVQFWYGALALSVIGMVIRTFTIPEPVLAQFRMQAERDGFRDQQLIDSAVLIGQVVWLVVYLALCGLWVLFIVKMRAGQNWARVVLATLGWIAVVLTVPMMAADQFATTVFYLATVVIEVVAIVQMFRGPANEYFVGQRTS